MNLPRTQIDTAPFDAIVDARNQVDARSLDVIERLHESFRYCEALGEPYLNLVGIFFHDLVFILTTWAIKKIEIDFGAVGDAAKADRLSIYPYVDYIDVMDGCNPREKNTKSGWARFHDPWSGNKVVPAVETITRLTSWRRRTIAYMPNSLRDRAAVGGLAKKGYKLHFPRQSRIALPRADEQIDVLKKCLSGIYDTLGVPDSHRDGLSGVIMNHIRSHLTSQNLDFEADAVVAGTMIATSQRIIAARALAAGRPVIAVGHGEYSLPKDEPIFGYGDLSYSSHFLAFGNVDPRSPEAGFRHARSLYRLPTPVHSNSTIVRQMFDRTAPIAKLPDSNDVCYVYVPTKFSGTNTYGPFRGLIDDHYLQWQRFLLDLLPGLRIKAHPKDITTVAGQLPADKIWNCSLEEGMDKADVLVFDYLSTAFAVAAATTKPMVYFDLGIRNLTPEAREAVKQRCIYVDVADGRVADIMTQLQCQASDAKTNTFSPLFSLADHDELRERTLINLIDELLTAPRAHSKKMRSDS